MNCRRLQEPYRMSNSLTIPLLILVQSQACLQLLSLQLQDCADRLILLQSNLEGILLDYPATYLIMRCFCVFGIAMASLWTPGESSLHCRIQNLVFASVNVFYSANHNFDSTLNALHPMAFLAEKENNESYTFGQILKQPDADDFIQAMIKEDDDPKSRDH